MGGEPRAPQHEGAHFPAAAAAAAACTPSVMLAAFSPLKSPVRGCSGRAEMYTSEAEGAGTIACLGGRYGLSLGSRLQRVRPSSLPGRAKMSLSALSDIVGRHYEVPGRSSSTTARELASS